MLSRAVSAGIPVSTLAIREFQARGPRQILSARRYGACVLCVTSLRAERRYSRLDFHRPTAGGLTLKLVKFQILLSTVCARVDRLRGSRLWADCFSAGPRIGLDAPKDVSRGVNMTDHGLMMPTVDTAGMILHVLCRHCGKAYDLATVGDVHHIGDCTIFDTPCCGRRADDRKLKSLPDFTRL